MQNNKETISISNMNKKGMHPRVPFLELKNAICGKKYELSIAFVDEKTSKSLNRKFRKKNKPTNILSFPISDFSGEIILCETVAKKESPKFGMPYQKFVTYLVIHGMLHLKGYAHGSTMEREELKLLKKF